MTEESHHPDAVHVEAVGLHVRLGKKKVRKDKRTLLLARYLIDPVTGKKLTVAKLPRLKSRVTNSVYAPANWGMMGNDAFGDCTCAAAGHALQVTSAVASKGKEIHTPPDTAIMSAYWATGDPPTPGADDNGRVELDVLNYWRGTGVDGSKLNVYASIIQKDPVAFVKMTKYTIDLFGFAYLGAALPISAQSQKVWSVTRGPKAKAGSWGGHAIVVVDYDASGVTCVTWGQLVKMTWGFFTTYCDEAYAGLTPEWLSQVGNVDDDGKSPAGLNVAALLDDLHAITA